MQVEKSLEYYVIRQEIEKYCSFGGGVSYIRQEEPSFEPLIIREQNQRLKEAMECLRLYSVLPIGSLKDIRDRLTQCQKGRILSEAELLEVLHVIRSSSSVLSYFNAIKDIPMTALQTLFSSLSTYDKLASAIQKCLNAYGEMKDDASETLKEIRLSLRRVDASLADEVNTFIRNHASKIVDSIVTERNGRMVVLVQAKDKNTFGGIVYGDSASGNASYIEPASLMTLNNRKESLLNQEKAEIQKILSYLCDLVKKDACAMIADIETIAILDAIFAKARWGEERDGVAATLCEERKIVIKQARHPLIDPENVVSNNYFLKPPHTTLLITGPNTGGKTVSMKIIGLFTLMSYAGIPVCASECELPIFDRIFADIGDDQSVVSSLSSFSAHMMKLSTICKEATNNSLVLLDEVGSGTDPQEGEALAIAILNDLRSKGCMTVTTTHYNRLKTYGKRHSDILLASVMFDMATLTPTYQYVEGLTGQSNAFEVAGKYGLPKGIVNYARFLKNQAKKEEDVLIEKLEKQLNDNVLKQNRLDALIKENETLKEALTKEKNKLTKQKDKILFAAQSEAEAYIEQAKTKADEILKEIRSFDQHAKYHEAIEKRHAIATITMRPTQKNDESYAFAVGDAVELKNGDQVCEILKIEKKDITLLMNGREVKVKKNQIRPSNKVIAKIKEEPTMAIRKSSVFSQVPMEVNLIGMYVDEGMDALDAYLDQVKVAGMKMCRIIHGDGSGALRNAVHKRLSSDASVKAFRLGGPGEGGTGATVVELK